MYSASTPARGSPSPRYKLNIVLNITYSLFLNYIIYICSQADVKPKGWAFEARVYAEDPLRGFLPAVCV